MRADKTQDEMQDAMSGCTGVKSLGLDDLSYELYLYTLDLFGSLLTGI